MDLEYATKDSAGDLTSRVELDDEKSIKLSGKDRKLRKEAKKYREALEKRGVIYLSRVPPFMKPNKARIMFEQYGEVTRLYLSEEDASQRAKRKQNGGNGSKQFNEGWLEYSDKKIAKSVAESLNNTLIGGKKGSFYHDDTWNIKYLKNFKWDYLTEKFAYERKIQENKMKLAMAHAKRHNAEIVEAIEKTKVQNIVGERKRKQRESESSGSEVPAATHSTDASSSSSKKARKFRQVQSMGTHVGDGKFDMKVDPSLLRSVFSKKTKK